MKKLLALVLALVMTLGLATVSSSAAYSDAADVSLNEAVDVMSAVGVFQGSDGKFSPKENLTREQAAKLIAYLDLGESAAEALPGVKVFSDVEATRWSAKYIAYCQDAGYIAGVGDGKFNPTGELTGYAFGKMVLCVLGYDADIEGFTGNAWSINVAKLLESNDIADGIDAAASATLTREQAAQYCLNALKATTVKYDTKGTSIEINGAKIATGASKAEDVTGKGNQKFVAISGEVYAAGTDYTVELGEKLYGGDLKLTSGSDDFDQPGNEWVYKLADVGTYAKSADAVLKNGSTYGDIYTAIGKTAVDNLGTIDLYIDGVLVARKSGTAGAPGAINTTLITKGSKTDFGYDAGAVTWGADDTDANGNGSVTNVFVEKAAAAYNVKICVINPHVAKVGSVIAATASADRKITFTRLDGLANPVENYETNDFAKGDIVLYTVASNATDTAFKVQSIKKLTPAAAAEVTAKRSNNANMTIGGTTYKFSVASTVAAGITVGDSYELYLDDAGFVLYADLYNEAVNYSDYLVVTADKYANDALSGKKITANAITLDGVKLSAITLGKLNGTKIDDEHGNSNKGTTFVTLGTIYSFSKDSDGKYNLKAVAAPYTDGALAITNGQAVTGFKFHAGATTVGTGITANASTKFVVFNSADDKVKVYDGIANMVNVADTATVTGAYLAKTSANTVATVVYVNTNASVSNSASAKDVVYLIDPLYNSSKDDDHTYNTYRVIKDGQDTTITLKDATIGAATPGLYYISQYDGDYVDTIAARTNGTPSGYTYTTQSNNIAAALQADYSDSVFTINGAGHVCNDKTAVFAIDSDGVVSTSSVDNLASTNTDLTYEIVEKTTDGVKVVLAIYVWEA